MTLPSLFKSPADSSQKEDTKDKSPFLHRSAVNLPSQGASQNAPSPFASDASRFQASPFAKSMTDRQRSTSAPTPQPSPARPFVSFRQTSVPAEQASPSALLQKNTLRTQPASPFSQTSPGLHPSSTSGRNQPQSPFSSQRPSFTPHAQASSPFRKDLAITDEEFILLRDFIYKQCGIFIAENRKYLIENRFSNRIKELNLKNYNDYYKFLRYDSKRDEELNKLFVLVTTNETSFFRNPPQLADFQNIVLTNIINECRKKGTRKLRIWSAGCSTGEEPYTLAIILNEVLKTEIRCWDIKITANDLSLQVLAAARNGIYNEYALRTTPKDLIPKYFTKENKIYRINQDVKRLVSFGQINLNNREQLKTVEKSHIVFCRNVIIYFDDDMKRRVINSFYDNLLPDGVLLIGHSETLHNISRSFQMEHYTGTNVYKKII